MARCKWCDRRGLFMSVDVYGLCKRCQPIIVNALEHARVIEQSVPFVRDGKTFSTRLSRCDTVLQHAESLIEFEQKGISTISPAPSAYIETFGAIRKELVIEEAHKAARKATEKASVVSTPSAKERALAAGILKVREITESLDNREEADAIEQRLRNEVHRATLEGFLEAARKAEFKGNTKKAIDQYQEALFLLKNDHIPDEEQHSQLDEIQTKLNELQG